MSVPASYSMCAKVCYCKTTLILTYSMLLKQWVIFSGCILSKEFLFDKQL